MDRSRQHYDEFSNIEFYEHDRRIRRGEWTYFVRGVKRLELVSRSAGGVGVLSTMGSAFIAALWDLVVISRQETWRTCVLRVSDGGWVRVVHRVRGERLDEAAMLATVSELAAMVEAGEFDKKAPQPR